MKSEEILRGLRDAGRDADRAPLPEPYDAPLGELFEARVAKRVLEAQRGERRPARAIPVVTALGGALAIAAAVLVWQRTPRGPSVDLPPYALSVMGGEDHERGGDAVETTTARLRADASLRLILRPSVDVGSKLAVSVAVDRAGSARAVTPEVRISPTGAVELRGRAGDLVGAAPGEATLVIAIAAEGTSVDAVALAQGGQTPKGVAVARAHVTIVP